MVAITIYMRGFMTDLVIKQCAIADVVNAPNFNDILNAYESECAIPEITGANPSLDTYSMLESLGKIIVIGAFSGSYLAGVLIVVVTEFPHFSRIIASSESFFVDRNHRKNGTGKRMLALAEEKAKCMGAVGLFMSAVANGRLEKAAPMMGFRKTNTQFFKVLN